MPRAKIESPETILVSTDVVFVDNEARVEGDQIIIERQVWTKAYRRSDREMIYQGDVLVLTKAEAVRLIQDLAFALAEA